MLIFEYIANLFRGNADIKKKEEDGTIFDELKYVEKICEKYLELAKIRNQKHHTLDHNRDLLQSIKKYENIDEKTHKRIVELMNEYHKLKGSKENMKEHILEHSKKLEHLSHYSTQEMKRIVLEVEGLEEERNILKGDMDKLKFEREALKEEHESMSTRFTFTKLGFQATVIMGAISLIAMLITWAAQDTDNLVMSTITSAFIIIFAAWLYSYKMHLQHELEINDKKQAKEVKLSNKIKVKYVNICSLLDFKYKTYDIDSVTDLKMAWGKYQETLNKKNEYNKMFHEFFDIEEHLEKLLRHKGIVFEDDIDMIDELTDLDEKMKIKHKALETIANIEKELSKIDVEQAKLADKLKVLEDEDQTEQKVVRKIIESYLEQINNINE